MTEEIIIDGVNVAECEYMLNNKIKGKQHCPAKAMPYAKETSCICSKSIDTPYNFCKHNSNCYYKQLKRLEQENKELKEKVKSLESEIRQKKMTIMMNNDHYLTVDENNRNYRSALEEIKEVASFHTTGADNEDVQNDMQVIIDKINEVLNSEA